MKRRRQPHASESIAEKLGRVQDASRSSSFFLPPLSRVPRLSLAPTDMPTRKGKATASPSAHTPRPASAEAPIFPFARYTSIVGVHTSLLAFCALILPGTSSLSLWTVNEAKPPRDIAQVLTESPVRTVAWICVGALILQSWWASWVRQWSVEVQTKKKEGESRDSLQRHAESYEWRKQRVLVCSSRTPQRPAMLIACRYSAKQPQ